MRRGKRTQVASARRHKRPAVSPPQLIRCPSCGESKPRDDFLPFIPSPTSVKRVRRLKTCNVCRGEVERIREASTWNWEHAICKSAAMSAASTSTRFDITPDMVIALAELQRGVCALTGLPFFYPEGLRTGQTLPTWIRENKIPLKDAGRVPVLVRASAAGDWTLGNVCILVDAVTGLTDLAASLQGVKNMIVASPDVTLHTRDDIGRKQRKQQLDKLLEKDLRWES